MLLDRRRGLARFRIDWVIGGGDRWPFVMIGSCLFPCTNGCCLATNPLFLVWPQIALVMAIVATGNAAWCARARCDLAAGAHEDALAQIASHRQQQPLMTEGTQRMMFSRRAMFVSGLRRSALPGLLATRMAYISIVDNERYALQAESNRVNLTLIPPRRGWIVDRYGKALADNRVSAARRHHPGPAATTATPCSPELTDRFSTSAPDEMDRIRRRS